MDTREVFRAAARDKGLSDEAIERWLQYARPRLELSRDADGPVVGQFFGLPHLPDGVEWPSGQVHLATIDLAAIPPGTHDLNLPPDGRLLFFSEDEITPEKCAVIYVPADTPVRQVDQRDRELVYDPFPLHATLQWSIPRERSQIPIKIDPNEEERAVEAVMSSLHFDDECQLSIGGHADETTGGIGYPVTSPEHEMLLAQAFMTRDLVGEAFGGSPLCLISYLIGEEALAARRFDQVTFVSDFNG